MENVIVRSMPAITQTLNYDQYLTRLNQMAVQDDEVSYAMGDLLVAMEAKFGRSETLEAAKICHIGESKATQRLWVTKRFGPSHSLRKTTLTFTHLRILAKLKNDVDVTKWADQAISQSWTAARLKAEMLASEDEQAQQDGIPCASCQNPLPEGDIVSITVGREPRVRCCGVSCGCEYLLALRTLSDMEKR